MDSLEAALAVENASVESFKSGMDLTLKQLISAFEKFNLKQINPPQGAKFDPHLHQAIAEVPAEGAEPGTVVNVVQPGYTIGERLLRPAMVTVAKAGSGSVASGTGGRVDTKV